MNRAIPHQLPLRRIPQEVMGPRTFQFFQRVQHGPGVRGVLLQGRPGPPGKRLVLSILRIVPAKVETDLPPGNQFIQKRLGLRTHPPPALFAARHDPRDSLWRPVLRQSQLPENLVDGDVPKMQKGRQPRCHRLLGQTPLLQIPAQASLQEDLQPIVCLR